MTDPRRSPTRAGRPRRATRASVPMTAEDRIAELEARLADLENGPSLRERGRNAWDRVMPPEASRHMRNAMRENLLAVRSIVDFWTARLDAADRQAETRQSRSRERIAID